MQSDIVKKIGLVLLVPTCAALVALGVFSWVLAQTSADSHFVNVAGRQRMMSEQLHAYAHMVRIGQEEDRDGLRKLVAEFDHALSVLERGGEVNGRELPPAPAEVLDEIAVVKRAWAPSMETLLLIAERPEDDPEALQAYEDARAPLHSLTQASDAVVTAYEARSRSLHRRMFETLVVIVALDLVLLGAGLWVIQHYVAERKRSEERLKQLAHYDGLTGLPNRGLFMDRFKQAIAHARRYKRPVAVLFLDLDGFKFINDTLGHDVGDRLLHGVAQRLSGCMREGDTVARLGGDEFVILLVDIVRKEDAEQVARKVITALDQPFVEGRQELLVTTSIGIGLYPGDGEDVQTLIKNADIAMYRAKEQGRNNYQFFAPAMSDSARRRLGLEKGLRYALERHELLLHYQPKVALVSGRITGMEALARWRHPELGMVSPALFIPLLERSGMITAMGEWTLRAACQQNKAWQDAGLPPLRVAVNLSARQFRHTELPDIVARVLQETGLDPRWLELEITEGVLMAHEHTAIASLQGLTGLGISLVVDDFGTGYSSLNSLKYFPIRALKIDRSLIRELPANEDIAAITRAVIGMGKSLKISVVAEGVENAQQLAFLSENQCDEIQGYYFSPPLTADAFGDLVREDRRLVCAQLPRRRGRRADKQRMGS